MPQTRAEELLSSLDTYDSSLKPIDRQALAALALVHGIRYVEKLLADRGQDLHLFYPLGLQEIRQCFALLKVREVLQKPAEEVIDRRRRREAERTLAAAREAAPHPVVVLRSVTSSIIPWLEALNVVRNAKPKKSIQRDIDFSLEVAKEACILQPLGYLRNEAALVIEWQAEGTLAKRLHDGKRVWERELELWATGLAASLVATHQAGYAVNGPALSDILLSHDGIWIKDQVRYLEEMDKYIKYKQSAGKTNNCILPKEKQDIDSADDRSTSSSSDSESDDNVENRSKLNPFAVPKKKAKEVTPEQKIALLLGEAVQPIPPSPKFQAVLADYSRSAPLGQPALGPLPWTPPEAEGRNGGSRATDVWCLGMVLWQVAGARRPIPAIPERFPAPLALAIQLALDPNPNSRATAEELFYILKPERAKRRHSVLPIRQHIAQFLDLGDGGYLTEVPPLRALTKKRDAILGSECDFLLYSGGDLPDDAFSKTGRSSKNLLGMKKSEGVSTALSSDDDDDKDSSRQLHKDSALRRLEASLSPEALEGWQKCIERVRRYQRQLRWRNLPGVRRARIERRRAAEEARAVRVKRIQASRRCALLTFWSEKEVVTWTKICARRAVDALVLKAGPPTISKTKKISYSHQQLLDNQQPLSTDDILAIMTKLRSTRASGNDARRKARRAIAQGIFTRDRKSDIAAAEAAVELARLDKSARRCCEAFAKAVTRIDGTALRYAFKRAEIEAEARLTAMCAANASSHATEDAKTLCIARTAFAVAALAEDTLCFRDKLREAARKIEASSKKRVPVRTAWILAAILYDSLLKTLADGEEARNDAAARLQAYARGRKTRYIMAEVWRLAELDALDELRALNAAGRAKEAIEIAAKEQPTAPSAPLLYLAQSHPRQACIRLAPSLCTLLPQAESPLSLQGWLTPGSDVILLELGEAEDDEEFNTCSLTEAIVDGLMPATLYTAHLRLLSSARSILRLTSTFSNSQQPLRFRTPIDTPEVVSAPSLAVVRLRASAAALLGSDANDHDLTTAVRVCWQAPSTNGSAIKHYICERARGHSNLNEPPTAWLRLKTVCANELVDLPPLHHGQIWWYRVAASNRAGRSAFSKPVRVDASPAAANRAPIFDPQALPPSIHADDTLYSFAKSKRVKASNEKIKKLPLDEELSNNVFKSNLQQNVYFKTLDVKFPLPASTMTTTFR